jgi:hypothetical protein
LLFPGAGVQLRCGDAVKLQLPSGLKIPRSTQRVEDPTVLALIADLLCTQQADRDGAGASEA